MKFKGELWEKKRRIGFPPGLEAPVDCDVAGLSVAAGVNEKRTVNVAGHSLIQHPKCPVVRQ